MLVVFHKPSLASRLLSQSRTWLPRVSPQPVHRADPRTSLKFSALGYTACRGTPVCIFLLSSRSSIPAINQARRLPPPLQEEGEGGHVEGRRHLRQPLQNSPHWRQVPLPFGSCPVSPRDGLCSRGAFLLFWPCFCLKRGRSSYHGARAHGRRDCRPMRTCAQMGIRGVAVHCCVPWHMPHRVSRRHGVAPRRGATPCHTNTAG